ncbi:NUDIX hydrolase [Streptomyces sp. NWU339]|uniref:NUDIX hydrolase n=1 Tax=Streptomyces sp. NWU339 TaxID=2185284 RepID=UPI00215A1182|nr:NUDIX hydrolase [Streptomyces sp. NWU339]
MKICDNQSVGVVIGDEHGRLLLFDRATFPSGAAPAAGHVDDHGTPEQTARAEVAEELGLVVRGLEMIAERWRSNQCRRVPGLRGIGHYWTVFRATAEGVLAPCARETRNVRWCTSDEVGRLAERTVRYAQGHLSADEFAVAPGLEPVWLRWFADLGIVTVPERHLALVDSAMRPSTTC